MTARRRVSDHTRRSWAGGEFECFSDEPAARRRAAGRPVRRRAVLRRRGADGLPRSGASASTRDWPPLVWEAWTGDGWSACEVDRDDTGGMNKAGRRRAARAGDARGVDHRPGSAPAGCAAGCWCPRRASPPTPHPRGSASLSGVHHRRHRPDGARRGRPRRGPRRAPTARPASGSRCSAARWCRGRSRACCRCSTRPAAQRLDGGASTSPTSGADDDRTSASTPFAGEVQFGPAVRQADGSLRQYGAVPPKGAHLRLSATGPAAGVQRQRGDRAGPGAQDERAVRGPGGEPDAGRRAARRRDIEDAKLRGPLVLRARGPRGDRRGLRGADQAGGAGDRPGALRPAATGRRAGGVPGGAAARRAAGGTTSGRIRREDLIPLPESLSRISAYLDERRLVGTRLVIEPPDYQWHHRGDQRPGPRPRTARRTCAGRCCARCTG